MSDPKRVSDVPYPIEVESGKSYFWCSCGQSQNQPFCDGSHKGTDFTPVKYEATQSKKIFSVAVRSPHLNRYVMVVTTSKNSESYSTI